MNIPKTFVSQGKVISGDVDISEGFNNIFSNIRPNLAKKSTTTKNKFSDYLFEETKENFIFGNVTPTIINKALNK